MVRADDKWGEVPVAFIACRDDSVSEAELVEMCRRDLAGYKRPRQFRFIGFADFPARPAARSSATNSRPASPRSVMSLARHGREEAADSLMPPLSRSPSLTVF